MKTPNRDPNHPESWVLLAPSGRKAILRFAADEVPPDARQANGDEVLLGNLARPFPWGTSSDPSRASKLWQEHRLGMGGLYHDRWFVTSEGRFGGAPNVPDRLPGSLRSSLRLDGGSSDALAENEGYAVVRHSTVEDQRMYRAVQLHALEHVVADGGEIIVTPLSSDGVVYVGFSGRCLTCPNAEKISFRQLQTALPEYRFELLAEWRGWLID